MWSRQPTIQRMSHMSHPSNCDYENSHSLQPASATKHQHTHTSPCYSYYKSLPTYGYLHIFYILFRNYFLSYNRWLWWPGTWALGLGPSIPQLGWSFDLNQRVNVTNFNFKQSAVLSISIVSCNCIRYTYNLQPTQFTFTFVLQAYLSTPFLRRFSITILIHFICANYK